MRGELRELLSVARGGVLAPTDFLERLESIHARLPWRGCALELLAQGLGVELYRAGRLRQIRPVKSQTKNSTRLRSDDRQLTDVPCCSVRYDIFPRVGRNYPLPIVGADTDAVHTRKG